MAEPLSESVKPADPLDLTEPPSDPAEALAPPVKPFDPNEAPATGLPSYTPAPVTALDTPVVQPDVSLVDEPVASGVFDPSTASDVPPTPKASTVTLSEPAGPITDSGEATFSVPFDPSTARSSGDIDQEDRQFWGGVANSSTFDKLSPELQQSIMLSAQKGTTALSWVPRTFNRIFHSEASHGKGYSEEQIDQIKAGHSVSPSVQEILDDPDIPESDKQSRIEELSASGKIPDSWLTRTVKSGVKAVSQLSTDVLFGTKDQQEMAREKDELTKSEEGQKMNWSQLSDKHSEIEDRYAAEAKAEGREGGVAGDLTASASRTVTTTAPLIVDASVGMFTAGDQILSNIFGYSQEGVDQRRALQNARAKGVTNLTGKFNTFVDEAAGADPASNTSAVGDFLFPLALTPGGEGAAGKLTAKGVEEAMDIVPRVAAGTALGVSNITKTGYKASTYLMGPKKFLIKKLLGKTVDPAFDKFGEVMEHIAMSPKGSTIAGEVAARTEQEVERLTQAHDIIKRRFENPVEIEEAIAKHPKTGKFVLDESKLNPAQKTLRESAEELNLVEDRLKDWRVAEDINKVATSSIKFTLNTGAKLGESSAILGGFSGIQADPEDIPDAVIEGMKMGSLLAAPFAPLAAGKAMIELRAERGRRELSKFKKDLDVSHPLFEKAGASRAKLTPEERQYLDTYGGQLGMMNGKSVNVLDHADIGEMMGPKDTPLEGKERSNAGVPDGFMTPAGDVFLSREKLPKQAAGHEISHALPLALGKAAVEILPQMSERMKGPAYQQFHEYIKSITPEGGKADLSEEVTAEIGRRVMMSSGGPEMFVGGETGSDVLKRWMDRVAPGFRTEKIDQSFEAQGAPYSRADEAAIRSAFFKVGKQRGPVVDTAGAVMPSIDPKVLVDAVAGAKALKLSEPDRRIQAAIKELIRDGNPSPDAAQIVSKASRVTSFRASKDIERIVSHLPIYPREGGTYGTTRLPITKGSRGEPLPLSEQIELGMKPEFVNDVPVTGPEQNVGFAQMKNPLIVVGHDYGPRNHAKLEGGLWYDTDLAKQQAEAGGHDGIVAISPEALPKEARSKAWPNAKEPDQNALRQYALENADKIDWEHANNEITPLGAAIKDKPGVNTDRALDDFSAGKITKEQLQDKLGNEEGLSFRASEDPGALKKTAIRRDEDGKIFEAPDDAPRMVHWMLNNHHNELADLHTAAGGKKYTWGYTSNDGVFLDKTQGHQRALETKQLDPGYKTEYNGEISSQDLREGAKYRPSEEEAAQIKRSKEGWTPQGDKEWMDYIGKGRTGSGGKWDTLDPQSRKVLGEELGVKGDKRFYEQTVAEREKITSHFVGSGEAQYRASEVDNTLNVGLKVGKTAEDIPIETAIAAIEKFPDVKVVRQTVHQSDTEPTLVATLSRPLGKEELHELSSGLQQDAVAQHIADGKGMLEGPNAKDWGGEFNGEFFRDHDGNPLTKETPKLEKATEADKAGATEAGEPTWSTRLRELEEVENLPETLENERYDLRNQAKEEFGSYDKWFEQYGEKPYLDKTGIGPAADKLVYRASERLTPEKTVPFEEGSKRISQRVPTGPNATGDALVHDLSVGLDSIMLDDKFAKKLAIKVKEYPGFKTEATEHKQVLEDFVNHVKDNKLFLFDKMPKEIRERAMKWYDGAHKLTKEAADTYGLQHEATAAVYAVLSPQNPWDNNVSLGERVLDIYHNHKDKPWTPEMEKTAARILVDKKNKKTGITPTRLKEAHKDVTGKTFSELDNNFKRAVWLRVFDEAHGSNQIRVIAPEGTRGEVMKKSDGKDAKRSWFSFKPIEKALNILDNPTKEVISKNMGEAHKVRNFNNNIIEPNSKVGDYTSDTHDVAAGMLKPLGGSAKEVSDSLGGAGHSDATGNDGTYGLFAEGGRRAAAERGVQPRQMQSVSWEAVKGLFSPEFKRSKNFDKVEELWQDYSNGKTSIEKVREEIFTLAGGIEAPEWSRASK